MNSTELDKFFKDLLPVLWDELLFYIPDNEITIEFIEDYKSFDFQIYYNQILVMDHFKGPIVYPKERDNSIIVLKPSALNKNIHLLLNKKAFSNEFEFNYVIEQYYEQLECLFYITNWLNDNLSTSLTLDGTIRGLFLLQFSYYKKHLETFLRHFYSESNNVPEGQFNLKKTIAFTFPKLFQKDSNKGNEIKKPEALDRKEELPLLSIKETILKKAKKQPLITEKEAETTLLKQIFKI